MKHVLLAILLVASFATAAHEPGKHAAPASSPVQARDPALTEIIGVVDRFGAALKAADFDTVRNLLDEHVLILESGGAERSREEYLGHHAIADAAFLGGASVAVGERHGAVHGNTGWLGTESEITPSGADAKPVLSTETMVLRKGPQGWRIVHIHWSSRAKKAEAP